MYKVIKRFKDRFTNAVYEIGDEYECKKKSRKTELVKKGYIEEIKEQPEEGQSKEESE